ncbi:cupin domain-containing protein [Tepidamorphus sp. 3E244]|uniref:cupin domain-containing protein n=1 Tax=Tepidamorphus sp. 3E244 TaxID=3385498 RepID=UPI0038FBF212
MSEAPAWASLSAEDIIRLLELQPHPEGGHYRETFRDPATDETGRSRSTAIYFLLAAGEYSHWHRVDAVETWHHHAGGPLALTISENGHDAQAFRLGPNLAMGERPQAVVPANAWQTAESLGLWTLVSCTVAPGFTFEGFEMAPPDWRPVPRGQS